MRPFPSEEQLHSMDLHAVEFPFSSERASTTNVAPLLFAKPWSARRARCASTRSVLRGSRGALRGLHFLGPFQSKPTFFIHDPTPPVPPAPRQRPSALRPTAPLLEERRSVNTRLGLLKSRNTYTSLYSYALQDLPDGAKENLFATVCAQLRWRVGEGGAGSPLGCIRHQGPDCRHAHGSCVTKTQAALSDATGHGLSDSRLSDRNPVVY